MPDTFYFRKDHRLRVIEPFWANWGKTYVPKSTKGRVFEGQDLYGYVTVEFCVGKKTVSECTVVTDYSLYVEDLDFEG